MRNLIIRRYLLLAFLASRLPAQDLVLRTLAVPDAPLKAITPLGEYPIRLSRIDPAPELTIVIAEDAFAPEDYEASRRFVAAVYKAAQKETSIQLAVLRHGGGLDVAGPFRNAAELQAVLRKTVASPEAAPPPDAHAFLSALADALEAIPSAWGNTLVAARIPASAPDAALDRYATAWLTRRFIALHRSVSFWDPASQPAPAIALNLARDTGGLTVASVEGFIEFLDNAWPLAGLAWDPAPLSKGFDLGEVRIVGYSDPVTAPFISAAPNAAIPSIPAYASLRRSLGQAAVEQDQAAARAAVAEALKINPSDREALKLGISLADRAKDYRAEIPLLETSLELTPADRDLHSKLGDLRYGQKDFGGAETALLRARELGASSAAASEQLARIRLLRNDQAHALEYLDESLRLDPARQDLWLLTADLAKKLGRTEHQAASLERALALGGDLLPERTELIEIYLAAHKNADAARHIDLERPRLPAYPDVQTTWAHFYERLDRPDDALDCWKRVVAADARREPAHYAIAGIYYAKSLWNEALGASEQGLSADAASSRLELVKTAALVHLDRIYEARLSLDAFSPDNPDPALLRRRAEMADVYGGDAPNAYRRFAEAYMKTAPPAGDLAPVLARGRFVSIRDGDPKNAEWFRNAISPPKPTDATAAAAKTETGVFIPGGMDALAFIAQAHPGIPADRFFLDYCRTLSAHVSGSPESVLYRKSISSYFEHLKQLLALARRSNDRATITLSISDKQGQSRTESVLSLLGWRMRRNKGKLSIESSEKSGQSQKQELAAALAIDQEGMRGAFESGKPFVIEIPFEWVPLTLGESAWRATLQADKYPGGVPEAFAVNPALAKAYIGLSSVDRATASVLAFDLGLPSVAGKYADLVSIYASALAVSNGRALVPGGQPAEKIWARLAGVGPTEPARFFRALFDKDEGKMLAWYFSLSQLDLDHQRFFTLSAERASAFYQAFLQSPEMQLGAGRLLRGGSFNEFLREIPLVEGHVDFPGSAEVWMVAKGRSANVSQNQKMLKKMRKAVAPEVEDEVLLRLARTRNKSNNERFSEVDNFLAVARIDEHREDSLDDESALLLAQNYLDFNAYYPYFSEFTALTGEDFKAFFNLLGKLRTVEEPDANLILGQINASLEILRRAMNFGGLPPLRATALFRSLCSKFASAPDPASSVSASLDFVRDLVGVAPDADRALESIVLGPSAVVDVEWNGLPVSLDPGKDRSTSYRRVLDLQKAPSLAVLLRMDESIRRLAAPGTGGYAALIKGLETDFGSIPVVEIPKNAKFLGASHAAILKTNPAKILPQIGELKQKTAKKKINPQDLQKIGREILTELAPQVRIALTAVVYAAYLGPDDIVVADDPLLARKHQSFFLNNTLSKKTRFENAALEQDSAGQGSFFVGGFAMFPLEAVRATRGNAGGNSAVVFINQVASIRSTPWSRYGDNEQRLMALRVRAAREWCVLAADNPALAADLADDTTGVLSLSRRREFLNALGSGDWAVVWRSVTLSDLLYLGERYQERYSKAPAPSPVDDALRQVARLTRGESIPLLGPLPAKLNGCAHPHLVRLAPYEEYGRHLFPEEVAERTAEMKLYLSQALDRYSLPAALLPAISESVAKRVFGAMKMADERDWAAALQSFAALDGKIVGMALQEGK